MKRLFSLCVLVALTVCCALAAATAHSGTTTAPARPQPATLDLADFGAVGDGVTDDGPALQRALDALADAGGGTLNVPQGRFAILTTVDKDFRGKAANVTISGVPSLTNPNPKGPGAELTIGLGLVSEFVIKTGPNADAILIRGLDTFLVSDIVFIGTPSASTDARVSLGLITIRDATVRHCEFYGLRSVSAGGAVLHAHESGLTLEKSVFLGSSGSSAHRIPVVQNALWKSFVMTETIFADYGQRNNYYGKLDLAPFSWVMLGNPAPVDNLSPRREASLRNVFFDEGGFIGVASIPDYYDPASKPADLIHVSDFRMNVSSLNAYGIYVNRGARNVLVERGEFMLSRAAVSAVELVNAGDVILDELVCGADADTIRADAATRRLTVINSTYNHLQSQAQSTKVIDSPDPDKDFVQYVRQRFLSALSREADPAANYFWADLLLQCNDVATCLTARRNELTSYLATSPAPTFSLSGRATKDNGSGLSGVSVNLSGSQTVAAATDATGDYTFKGLPTSGDYTLTPSRTNYTFTPASQAVNRPAGDRTVNFAGKANRYRIAGRIANASGAAVVGATVTLSGTETGTTTTDSSGNYSLNVAAEGTYTVTPTRANYSFAPASRTLSNILADQTANFTGTLLSYTISGRVTEGASGLAGVTVTLSGSMAGTKTTDANGNYSFTAIAEGNYTVTPARAHYTFAPPSAAFNNLSANRTANFAAALKSRTVSGHVRNINNTGIPGVTVTVSGTSSATTTTNASGVYSFPDLPAGGNFTVTPTLAHHDMTPASRTFSNLQADQTGDFVAAFTKYKISGRVTRNGAALSGVTVTLSGTEAGTTTTDANGNYSFNATAHGNYTVTPTRTHYTFAPAAQTFNDLLAPQNADFAAAPAPGTLVNFALSSNGGVATASSSYNFNYPAASVINGDRRGLNWNAGGGWNDATAGAYPDWVEVAFAGERSIDEVDVFTLQDDPAAPLEPTEQTAFTKYGVTGMRVEYWTGSAWAEVPGGTVAGNDRVWRRLTFSPVSTTKIRVLVTGALAGYSRLVEVEAWGAAPAPKTNVALASSGGVATASSSYSQNYPASSVINGDRRGLNWNAGGGWNDATAGAYPDWVEVAFNGEKSIEEINVFTLQDDPAAPIEPTEAMTFTKYGVTGMRVEYWTGSAWAAVPGGVRPATDRVWNRFSFAPLSTTKVRVVVTGALAGYSRLVEVEAWQPAAAAP